MARSQQHRGADPEDHDLFAPAAIDRLRCGMQDCVYLLDRGYTADSVLDVVGRRYSLRARQRDALRRAMCTTDEKRLRERSRRDLSLVTGMELALDGFNFVIGLEVALSGGVLLECRDGAIRDLAGLRGSYRMVSETDTAIALLGEVLSEFRPSGLQVLLDRPVANSGRLRARILERAAAWSFEVEANLVANPDRDLRGRQWVVSSDSVVLDSAASWVDLLGYIIRHRLPDTWRVKLADP